MDDIKDLRQQMDDTVEIKNLYDEIIHGIVDSLHHFGNTYIKYYFMKTEDTVQIPHDLFQIMEKMIKLDNFNYHIYALWDRYHKNSIAYIFFTKKELDDYILEHTFSEGKSTSGNTNDK